MGADGRGSAIRRQAGIELCRDEAINYIAGLLLDDLAVPDDHDAIARKAADFAPYGHERIERMRRLRLLADAISVTFAEDADNQQVRRAWVGQRMATMDPEVFRLFAAIFAGPETVPPELVDESILARIRAA